MKKIYFVHENTASVEFKSVTRHPDGCQPEITVMHVTKEMTTSFVVREGYVAEPGEEYYHANSALNRIYRANWVNGKVAGTSERHEVNNYLPGLIYDTYAEAFKMLILLLEERDKHDKCRETYNELITKHPELVI